MNEGRPRSAAPTKMRIAIAVLGIIVCLFLMQASARFGFSRLLTRYALVANSIPAADEAVRLSPSDPEAHRARSIVSTRLQQSAEALKSLELATRLRHRDDYLWLDLGNAREEVGDARGALAAMDQAVHWAPYYAHTHWQRGNLLLRMGRSDEAFAELRTAAAANGNYLPNVIDLAWGITRGDASKTETLVDVNNDAERLAFVLFLARKGQGREVLNQLRSFTSAISKEKLNEVVQLLNATDNFREAYSVQFNVADASEATLFNGGFEKPLVVDGLELGGWTVANDKNRLAIDVSEKFAGSASLQVNLHGNWDPGTPLLSQTILVQPSKTYHVSFSVKSKDLVTGGPPMFTVSDAKSNQLLGKSESFPSADSWRTLSFEFTTLATSEAAVIRLQRNSCDPSPCPIFGVFWLDEIAIK